MKKILRKVTGVVLAAVMTAGLLSGCGNTYDPIQEAFGYPGSTVMMTVDGRELTASDLYFWMAQNADYIYEFFPAAGMEVDWSATMGGDEDMDTYVKNESKNAAILYNVVTAKAEENGYSLTKEDETAYEEDLASAKENLGGEEAYDAFLKSMLLTPEGMKEVSSVVALYNHMVEGMCREGGAYAPTDEDLAAYAEENDLLSAKHILLQTKDSATGEALSEADAAAKKATADDLLAQLQAISDPAELETKFDALMNEYSEDSGLATNPDGYLFSAGEMVSEFEEMTRSLEPGQVGMTESDYGYHIILRLDPATSDTLQSDWAATKMNDVVQEWVNQAEVVTTEDYDNLTTAEFYETLLAYRDTLDDGTEEEDASVPEESNGETEGTGGIEEAEGTEGEPADDDTGDTQPTDTQPADGEAEASADDGAVG